MTTETTTAPFHDREGIRASNRPDPTHDHDAGRRRRRGTAGATVWLTGLPSAGKTTVARALADTLRAEGRRVEVLDGDEVRAHLTAGLGFSRADRDANVTRIGWLAQLLARNGVLVLVPVIAPYADTRAAVRAAHDAGATPYLEVHVATPLEVCATRDVKGLYARQRTGEVHGLTGVDDPYEAPADPDLRLDTATVPLAGSVDLLRDLLHERGLL
jgi:adenylylsulfate kinase